MALHLYRRHRTDCTAGRPNGMATLRDLIASGDVITRVEGIFSGTLSYLFNAFDGAVPFSAISEKSTVCETDRSIVVAEVRPWFLENAPQKNTAAKSGAIRERKLVNGLRMKSKHFL